MPARGPLQVYQGNQVSNREIQQAMGLNETLDRLAKEREMRENYNNETTIVDSSPKSKIADLAERIFFQRMLKDINHGLSEPKIDAMIDRSLMIATKLYNRLHK